MPWVCHLCLSVRGFSRVFPESKLWWVVRKYWNVLGGLLREHGKGCKKGKIRLLNLNFIHLLVLIQMILVAQKVFNRTHNMLEKNPDTSQFPSLQFLLFSLHQLLRFPDTHHKCILERLWGACSVFLGCVFMDFQREPNCQRRFCRISLSPNYLGKMFENLEKILSSPLGFHLREHKCSPLLN